MTELYQSDALPEPSLMIEALRAARKVNDYAAAVRFLEIMKFKCGKREKEVWPYVMQEVCRLFLNNLVYFNLNSPIFRSNQLWTNWALVRRKKWDTTNPNFTYQTKLVGGRK